MWSYTRAGAGFFADSALCPYSSAMTEVEDQVQRARDFWDDLPTSGVAHFIEEYEALLTKHSPSGEYHYTPSRFTVDDFALVPHKRAEGLLELEATLRECGIATTLTFLPLFLQLDPMVFATHVKVQIPHAAAAPSQLPVALELLKQLTIPFVIASSETAERLDSALLAATHVPRPHIWYIIQPFNSPARTSTLARTVYYDLHLAPGLSVAHQCAHLAREDKYRFHPSERFHFESRGDVLCVTSLHDTPVPLYNVAIGSGRLAHENCACGRTTILTL